MAAGTILTSQITGYPNLPQGVFPAVQAALVAAGFSGSVSVAPDGIHVSDVATALNAFNSYSGSAAELQYWQTAQQAALDTLFNANFDLAKFIRAGTATNVVAAGVGTFLATITNNYRSLRAQIAAATSVAQVQAININSGWPSNP